VTYFCVIIGKEEYDLLDQFLVFLWTFPSRIERYSSMAAASDHLGYSLVFQVFPYRDTGAYRQGMGGDPGEKDMPMVVPGLQIECKEDWPQERGRNGQSLPPCEPQASIRPLNFTFRLSAQQFGE